MAEALSFSIGGRKVNGQIDLDRTVIVRALWAWPDCDFIVTFDRDEPKRTLAANRYLFGVLYRDIAAYTGQSKESIHDEMCARFTTETVSYVNPASGELIEIEVVKRTSGMKVSRFHKFVQDVKLFAQEWFGLTFEEPGDDFYRERDRAAAKEAA